MNTTKAIKSTVAKLKATDFSNTIAAVDHAKANRVEIETAIENGRETLARAMRELNEVRAGTSIDADQAADALLSGGTVVVATKTEAEVQATIDGLQTGMNRLRERAEDARAAEARAKSMGVSELAQQFAELPPVLEAEAREAIATLATLFASANALAGATRTGIDLADKLKRVMEACHQAGLIDAGPHRAAGEIADLLNLGSDTMTKLGLSWFDTVTLR